MQGGVDDTFEAGIPLPVSDHEKQAEQLGEDNAVLIMRSEDVGRAEPAVKIRHENDASFAIPLIPIRQVAPKFFDDDELCAKNNEKQAEGQREAKEYGTKPLHNAC